MLLLPVTITLSPLLPAVTRCQPEVTGRQQLEQQLLEARGDFAGFVRAMRREFKQLAAAQQSI